MKTSLKFSCFGGTAKWFDKKKSLNVYNVKVLVKILLKFPPKLIFWSTLYA